jgi:hypothetical protein
MRGIRIRAGAQLRRHPSLIALMKRRFFLTAHRVEVLVLIGSMREAKAPERLRGFKLPLSRRGMGRNRALAVRKAKGPWMVIWIVA